MNIRSRWARLRQRERQVDREPLEQTESPEQKRLSAVDIAGHGGASEAKRLADPR